MLRSLSVYSRARETTGQAFHPDGSGSLLESLTGARVTPVAALPIGSIPTQTVTRESYTTGDSCTACTQPRHQ